MAYSGITPVSVYFLMARLRSGTATTTRGHFLWGNCQQSVESFIFSGLSEGEGTCVC